MSCNGAYGIVVALVAGYVAAWQAARIDPLVAPRHE